MAPQLPPLTDLRTSSPDSQVGFPSFPTVIPSSPLSVAPLLAFYTCAQAWTLNARESLSPSPSASPTKSSLRVPTQTRTRRRGIIPYPSSSPKKAASSSTAHVSAVSVKTEEEDVSLHSLDHAQPAKSKVEELLDLYDAMLWERVESCKRIEKLIERSAALRFPDIPKAS